MLLHLIGGARVVVYFRNNDQVLLVTVETCSLILMKKVVLTYIISFIIHLF